MGPDCVITASLVTCLLQLTSQENEPDGRRGKKKELVTAINSCLFLWTGDSWRQVCTNCGVVTGTPNTLLCCWITHAEPSNLPSLTKIKFIAAITKLEKMENSSGEVQQQFGNNDIQRLKLAAWRGGQGDETIDVWSSSSPFVSKIGIQNLNNLHQLSLA